MNKKCHIVLPLLMVFLFLLSTSIVPTGMCIGIQNTTSFPEPSTIYELRDVKTQRSTGILYVDADNIIGPWDGTLERPYQYIQDGIDNATTGDTIFVFSGLYYEHVVINKHLNIVGENSTDTIIDGSYGTFVVHIIEHGVVLQNFSIRNSGGYTRDSGILIDSENNSLQHCIVYRTKTSMWLNTGNNEVYNCTLYANGEGIFFNTTQENTIRACYFYHNAIGVHSETSSLIDIRDSYAHTNGIGFLINASSHITITHCALSDNNDNQGGISLIESSNVTITNTNFYHNGFGIYLVNSSYVSLTYCDFRWNTHLAVMLKKSSHDVFVSCCNIDSNLRDAARSHDDGRWTISNCNIANNTLYGLYCDQSFCTARLNWWGVFTGPSMTRFGPGERITIAPRRVTYFPWRLMPLKHIGSDWEIEDFFIKAEMNFTPRYLDLPGNDTDYDGCPDWWEEKWGYDPFTWDDHLNLDPDKDSLNNIEECFTDQWGSNPFHQDVFLEFDWIQTQDPAVTNKPSVKLIDDMKSAFALHNITLHVDDGSLGSGEEIPYIRQYSYAELRDLYWNYFLHNDLNNPRKGIFHYGLIGNYGPGQGFAFIGWDNLDSFAISGQQLDDDYPTFTREQLIITGSMHETGHTLGLIADRFEGIDNRACIYPRYVEFWQYRNYKSVLNYRYAWSIIDYSDGLHTTNDFNDWENLDFSFFKNSQFDWPK